MSVPQDGEAMAEKDYQVSVKRVEIVELILEENVDLATKNELREKFCQENHVSMRTVQNWLARHIKDGPIYRFLQENGLDHKQRQGMRGDIVHRASHSLEAPNSLSPSTNGQLPF